MSHDHRIDRPERSTQDPHAARPAGRRGVLGTSWPVWLLLGLTAIGLPRTILADLGIVQPESSWVYFVLALTPFAVWFVLAAVRRSSTPVKDQLLAGFLYAVSLIIVHELFWNVATAQSHQLPAVAVGLSEQLASPLSEAVLHISSGVVALIIGIGAGVVAAIIALIANRVRAVPGPAAAQAGTGE